MRKKTTDEGRQEKGMNNQLEQELNWLRQRVTELEQAKEAPQKNEKKYHDLVESLPDVIYLVDEHGIVTYINPAIETTLGYTPAEVIGHHFTEFVYQEDLPLIKEGFQQILSGHVITNEYRCLTKLGEIRWMRTASRPTFKRNRVVGAQGMLMNITEQKLAAASLRESERRYRSIFESTTDALLIFNLDGVIVAANPTAYTMYGYQENELIGLHAKKIIHPDYFHGFSNFRRNVDERGRFYIDSINLRKDGSQFHIEMHGTSFTYHGKQHLLSVIRDVTERVKAENALRDSKWKIESLHKTARLLEACDSDEEVYRLTVKAAEEILELSMCTLDVVEGNKLVVKATSSNLPPEASKPIDLDIGLAGKTYRTGKTTVFGSMDEVLGARPTREDFKSGISAPIGGIGVFQAASKTQDAFTEEDARLLELLLGHTAEAVKRIHLQNKLKEQAIRDPLTGVYNRYYLNELLAQESARSKRYDRPIAFLMIDIDRFKEINDRFGHQMGDRVLRETAKLLEEQVRDSDIVVRYGGDEFLIILPETIDEIDALKERIHKEVARYGDILKPLDFPITLSIGSAYWNPDDSNALETILAEADRQMYKAKRLQEQENQLR